MYGCPGYPFRTCRTVRIQVSARAPVYVHRGSVGYAGIYEAAEKVYEDLSTSDGDPSKASKVIEAAFAGGFLVMRSGSIDIDGAEDIEAAG